MRFDDLEIWDLNGDEDRVIRFPSDSPSKTTKTKIKKEKEDEEEEAFDWKKEIKSFAITLLITLAVVLFLKSYVIINANVPTGSMENEIMPGDNIIGNRLAYLKEGPERGDVIFFYFPDDESQQYVKRVIGLPGETVTIINGKIYIDDATEALDEPYLKEEWTYNTGPFVFEIPEDCYLCMGDNRNRSADAREWMNPYVKREKIIGKAIFTYFPFNHWGFVE
ncbi:MAG: signal peptidase I [Agathobacter sp.]|nr:signal peptidase I [Agathobacter sp.]